MYNFEELKKNFTEKGYIVFDIGASDQFWMI